MLINFELYLTEIILTVTTIRSQNTDKRKFTVSKFLKNIHEFYGRLLRKRYELLRYQ